MCNGILPSTYSGSQSSCNVPGKQVEISKVRKKEVRLVNSTITTVPISE